MSAMCDSAHVVRCQTPFGVSDTWATPRPGDGRRIAGALGMSPCTTARMLCGVRHPVGCLTPGRRLGQAMAGALPGRLACRPCATARMLCGVRHPVGCLAPGRRLGQAMTGSLLGRLACRPCATARMLCGVRHPAGCLTPLGWRSSQPGLTHAPGVNPYNRANTRAMWLWSAKPLAAAASARGVPWRIRRRARLARRCT